MAKNGKAMDCGSHSQLCESNESRISSLEESVIDLSVGIGKLQVHQEFMSEAIKSSDDNIIEKLERLLVKFDSFEDRFYPIELKDRESRVRSRNIKSVVKSVMVALVGALSAGLGKFLWDYLGNK